MNMVDNTQLTTCYSTCCINVPKTRRWFTEYAGLKAKLRVNVLLHKDSVAVVAIR